MTNYSEISNFIIKVCNAHDTQTLDALPKPPGGIDSEDQLQDTALSYVAIRGNVVAADWLILNGAKINHQNKCGQTPLIHAVLYRKIEIIKILLKHNADTAIKSLDGIALDIAKKKYKEYKSDKNFADQYHKIITLISQSYDNFDNDDEIDPNLPLQTLQNNPAIYIQTWNSYNSSQKASIIKQIFDFGYNITKYQELFRDNMQSFEKDFLSLKDSNWYIYELIKHDIIDITQPECKQLKDRYEKIDAVDSILFFLYHITHNIIYYFADDGKLSYVEATNINIIGEDVKI